jgi:GNAT superfamily N-acetyltransferase
MTQNQNLDRNQNPDQDQHLDRHQNLDHHQDLEFREMTLADSDAIVPLANKLHPHLDPTIVSACLAEMFNFPTYHCFGLWQAGKLVAMSNGWITVRFYSGKQLEVDNVIVDPNLRSKGVGKYFFACIQDWAHRHQCKTIELNTFVQNSKSHKFYFNEGYAILGFHFQKVL